MNKTGVSKAVEQVAVVALVIIVGWFLLNMISGEGVSLQKFKTDIIDPLTNAASKLPFSIGYNATFAQDVQAPQNLKQVYSEFIKAVELGQGDYRMDLDCYMTIDKITFPDEFRLEMLYDTDNKRTYIQTRQEDLILDQKTLSIEPCIIWPEHFRDDVEPKVHNAKELTFRKETGFFNFGVNKADSAVTSNIFSGAYSMDNDMPTYLIYKQDNSHFCFFLTYVGWQFYEFYDQYAFDDDIGDEVKPFDKSSKYYRHRCAKPVELIVEVPLDEKNIAKFSLMVSARDDITKLLENKKKDFIDAFKKIPDLNQISGLNSKIYEDAAINIVEESLKNLKDTAAKDLVISVSVSVTKEAKTVHTPETKTT